jgi:hypothetical protein
MFGSGSDLRRTSATTAETTAYREDLGAAFLIRSRSSAARGSPELCTKSPKPGMRSPRRSWSPTTRAASDGSRAEASMASAASDAPPLGMPLCSPLSCIVPPSAPRPVAMTAYGSARTEAATRAAKVEAASSWSASSASAARRAPTRPGSGRFGQILYQNRPAMPPSAIRAAGAPDSDAAAEPGSGRQSTMPAMMFRPATITAGGSRCSRIGSVADIAGTMTLSRSSGSVPSGSAACAFVPAAIASGVACHGSAAPAFPRLPVHSQPATSSNGRHSASLVTSMPRYRNRPSETSVSADSITKSPVPAARRGRPLSVRCSISAGSNRLLRPSSPRRGRSRPRLTYAYSVAGLTPRRSAASAALIQSPMARDHSCN